MTYDDSPEVLKAAWDKFKGRSSSTYSILSIPVPLRDPLRFIVA